MRIITTMFLAVAFLCFLFPIYGQVWEKHIIDPRNTWSSIVEVVDIDDDGDMDVVVADYYGGMLLLYENNNMTWTKDTIDANLNGPVGLDIADFDNDGKLDVIVSDYMLDVTVWYKNEGEIPLIG